MPYFLGLLLLIPFSTQIQCDHPFNSHGKTNRCFFQGHKKVPYAEAQAICRSIPGASLPSIHSAFQNEMLYEILDKDSQPLWLGLFKENPRIKRWKWDDSTPVDYTNWAQINEDDRGVIMIEDGKWTTANEADLHSVLCFDDPQNEHCPGGWTWFNETGSCYMVVFGMSFNQGEAYCQKFGGHLTSVHSVAENNFLYDLAYSPCDQGYGDPYEVLLGGTWSIDANRVVNWTDGTNVDFMGEMCFTQWNPIVKLAADDSGCGLCGARTWLTGITETLDDPIQRSICKIPPLSPETD